MAVGLLLGGPAYAGNVWGGDTVEKTTLHTEAGFSHAEIGIRVPVGRNVELMPRSSLSFSTGFELDLRALVGLDFRIQVAEAPGFHAAVTLSIPVTFDPDPGRLGVGFGLLYPGVVMDITLPRETSFGFGVRLEDDLYLRQGRLSFEGYVPFYFTLEGDVGPWLRIGGKLEAGPSFDNRGGVRLELRALLGIDVLLAVPQ